MASKLLAMTLRSRSEKAFSLGLRNKFRLLQITKRIIKCHHSEYPLVWQKKLIIILQKFSNHQEALSVSTSYVMLFYQSF
ncbi:hypothetical protein CISIN_1g034903mg [Citrus sinensis]|uniref:Uncharacterized protein n=1 Tax=Citrus sinensis TaxID=2711 RepID=A0A067EJC1_CITSI|nr:hypothetical protein CISIN_1g034903mg [Citrus sinensis]